MTATDDLLQLPQTALARETLTLVTSAETASIANHSVRSYLFARLLAAHRGAEPDRDYDATLLFLACVLHDIGLTDEGNRHQRFEVDGADRAAEFLTAQGLPSDDIETVWEAIALHTSGGIAERRGPICDLTRSGIGMDFGRGADIVLPDQADSIHRAYPRLDMARSLVDAIVEQANGRPEKAARYTFAGELVRERSGQPPVTALEQAAAAGPWGD
jgi:HD domain